jgi:hypothetical protein
METQIGHRAKNVSMFFTVSVPIFSYSVRNENAHTNITHKYTHTHTHTHTHTPKIKSRNDIGHNVKQFLQYLEVSSTYTRYVADTPYTKLVLPVLFLFVFALVHRPNLTSYKPHNNLVSTRCHQPLHLFPQPAPLYSRNLLLLMLLLLKLGNFVFFVNELLFHRGKFILQKRISRISSQLPLQDFIH